jgi:hypothetical protein
MAEGYVYFIHAPAAERVKIGFTERHPDRRLRQIQSHSPVPLVGLGVVAGTFATEAELHARWAPLRDRGEWFRADPELLAFVADRADPWPKARPPKAPAPGSPAYQLMTLADLAARWGCDVREVRRRCRCTLLPWAWIGLNSAARYSLSSRYTRFRPQDVEAWEERNLARSET